MTNEEYNAKTRAVQLSQLSMLQIFIKICKKHNLRWYMIGGSLIGVLRHKGFIPWDDDIDIGMPRNDYDKFVSLQNDSIEPGYSVITHQNDKKWQFNFSRFVDDESEIIMHLTEIPQKCKIWIDVFPIDGLPTNKMLRWLHLKHILYLRYLVQIANVRNQVAYKATRPWYEKVVIRILHFIPLGKLIDVNKTLSRMEKVLKKYDFCESLYAGNLLGKNREREITKTKWWGDPVSLPFENIMVNCPVDSDKIERNIYGDYMTLPDEKDRESHDIEIIKLRNYSTSDYS